MARIILCLLTIFISQTLAAQTWPQTSNETKAGTRWWWHGSALTKEEMQKSMREYSRTGIGTVEITPIYGVKGNEKNDIEYLSPQWMQLLQDIQDEGRRDSIIVDMNNGTGWPFGGPNVPIEEAACKTVFRVDTINTKSLTADDRGDITLDISAPQKERKHAVLHRVMAHRLNSDGTWGAAKDITSHAKGSRLTWRQEEGEWLVITLYLGRTRLKVERAAPGGEGLVIDHFDRNALKNYLKRFDDAFGKSQTPYPHAFFNDSYEVERANWTPTLLDEFHKRRGYRLEYHFPELLYGKDTKVLSDYRETVSELLLENFTEQWTEWAHRHGALTRSQAHGSPGNLIDLYAAVDIPEIEGFGLSDFGIKGLRTDQEFTRKNFSDVSMLKYASSAAHITGKPLTSSETCTWLTEHFRTSLSQMKPDIDLMFTCGVNRMFFHGTCYSPSSEPWPGRKFYASVDMSPTNSIWHDAPYMMKYIERCQSFLQMGAPDNDFLVYLPIRDMWAMREREGERGLLMMFDIHSMERKAPAFIQSIMSIDSCGFDCDYISDKYLQTTTFRNGRLQTAGGARYKALIIPGSGRMADATMEHIRQLKAAGAVIIYGTDNNAMRQCAEPEQMKTAHALRYIRRSNSSGHHYFIANLTPNDIDTICPLAVEFSDALWFNPLTGSITRADISSKGIRMTLRSGESRILQTFNTPLDNTHAIAKEQRSEVTDSINLTDNSWSLEFIHSEPYVSKTFLLPRLQTWETLDDDSVRVTMGTGVYTTTVSLSRKQAKKRWVIELGDVRESARVYINNRFVGCAWAAPFALDCKDFLKRGSNTIRIEVTNLPANRISHLDRQGVAWRKFKEINFVDLKYKKTTYDKWEPVKSGLNSDVVLYMMDDNRERE